MNKELLKWFDHHYMESSFDGRFQISYRKKGETHMIPLVTNDRVNMTRFLEKMYIRPEYDYYITANAITGVKRNLESLFSYHNIVIDVDHHRDVESEHLYELIEELIWRIHRDMPDEMPAPCSVVETGRGIQLWWAIEPVHQKCKYHLHLVRNQFMKEIQKIIAEYSCLDGFSVDKGASSNDIGYFRLPCTFNTKVNKKVEVTLSKTATPYRLQHLLVLVSLLKKREQEVGEEQEIKQENEITSASSGKEDQKYKQDFTDHEVFMFKNIQTLAFFRIRQLILLRKLRNNDIYEETRNNFNFLMYNTLLPAMGEEEAWKRLLSFNLDFKQPMNEKELEGVIVSAKEKGGYKYSNLKIIEFLDISPNEQEEIQLFSGKQKNGIFRFSKNPSRDASRSLVKECRDKKVHYLKKEGMTITQISQETGLSAPTISKILQTTSDKKQKKQKALDLLLQGYSVKEVATLSGFSLSTINRLKANLSKQVA